jgi:hypothetical protein
MDGMLEGVSESSTLLLTSNSCNGMTPDEARRQARIKLGGSERTREECREAHRLTWVDSLIRDFRYAIRSWRRTPLLFITGTLSSNSTGSFRLPPPPPGGRTLTLWLG